jgi:hypothetical protein
MSRHRLTPTGRALAIALGLLAPALATAADGQPNFSGTYAFVAQRSDDLRAKIGAAVGPDYTVGSKKSEQARLWIRSWLQGMTEDPASRILTIEQTATEFHSGMGEEVNIYYFGREATSEGPAGGNLKVSVSWQGAQLVTQEKQMKGKGRITATYSLQAGGKALLVDWTLEHETLKEPLSVRLAFDRVSK